MGGFNCCIQTPISNVYLNTFISEENQIRFFEFEEFGSMSKIFSTLLSSMKFKNNRVIKKCSLQTQLSYSIQGANLFSFISNTSIFSISNEFFSVPKLKLLIFLITISEIDCIKASKERENTQNETKPTIFNHESIHPRACFLFQEILNDIEDQLNKEVDIDNKHLSKIILDLVIISKELTSFYMNVKAITLSSYFNKLLTVPITVVSKEIIKSLCMKKISKLKVDLTKNIFNLKMDNLYNNSNYSSVNKNNNEIINNNNSNNSNKDFVVYKNRDNKIIYVSNETSSTNIASPSKVKEESINSINSNKTKIFNFNSNAREDDSNSNLFDDKFKSKSNEVCNNNNNNNNNQDIANDRYSNMLKSVKHLKHANINLNKHDIRNNNDHKGKRHTVICSNILNTNNINENNKNYTAYIDNVSYSFNFNDLNAKFCDEEFFLSVGYIRLLTFSLFSGNKEGNNIDL